MKTTIITMLALSAISLSAFASDGTIGGNAPQAFELSTREKVNKLKTMLGRYSTSATDGADENRIELDLLNGLNHPGHLIFSSLWKFDIFYRKVADSKLVDGADMTCSHNKKVEKEFQKVHTEEVTYVIGLECYARNGQSNRNIVLVENSPGKLSIFVESPNFFRQIGGEALMKLYPYSLSR